MNIEFFNIRIKVCLLKDINEKEVPSRLSKLLFYSMNKDIKLKNLHKKSGLKGYSFSGGLVPFERERIYFEGEFYDFNIKVIDEELAKLFVLNIQNLENDDFIVVDVDINKLPIKNIDKIYTVSPTVVTLKNSEGKICSWTKSEGEDILKRSLVNNLIKKYNFINQTNFANIEPTDIFEKIEIKNNYPIPVIYKKAKILGYKYEISFKQNPIAQELAKIALVLGVGDKNSSLGTGFVKIIYKNMEEKC